MHLSALRIRGFKSFRDPLELRFEGGVAVVVGPNGSGKSNIADALQWAMASQPPDGHTIVLISTGHVTASAMSPKFDLLRDTRVVTQVVNSPLILVVNPSSSYQSLSDLFKAIKDAW